MSDSIRETVLAKGKVRDRATFTLFETRFPEDRRKYRFETTMPGPDGKPLSETHETQRRSEALSWIGGFVNRSDKACRTAAGQA